MKRHRTSPRPTATQTSSALDHVLLGICLCVLALRCTFTESPVSRMSMLSFSLFDLSHSLIVSTVLLFALGLWFLRGLWRGKLSYLPSGLELGLGLFALVAIISFVIAADKRAAISESIIVISPILMCLLLVQVLNSPLKIRLVLAVVAALGLVCAFECSDQFFATNQATIQQYEKNPQTMLEPLGLEIGSLDHFLFEHRLYSRGVNGFFTTRNSAGSFLLMAFLAALALSLEAFVAQRRKLTSSVNSLICSVSAVVILGALLLTKSKGAVAGLILASACLMLFYRFRGFIRRHALILVLGGLGLATAAAVALACYGHSQGRLPGGNSMLVRWQYWHASGQMIADHPWVGIGAGNFAHYYHQYKAPQAIESIADPHNIILSLLAQYGPLGLIGFLVLLILPLRRLFQSSGKAPSPLIEQSAPPAKRSTYGYVFVISTFMLLARPLLSNLEFDAPMVVLLTAMIHTLVFSLGLFFLNGLSLNIATDAPADSPISATKPILFCMVLGLGLANMTDFALFEPGVWTCFWAMMACLIALTQLGCPIEERPLSIGSWHRPVAIASLAFGACVYVGVAVVPVVRSAVSIGHANVAISQGLPDLAHAHLYRAAQNDRLTDAAWYRNGRMYLHQYDQSSDNVNQLHQAKNCFTEALARNPVNFKNHEKLTDTLERLGLYREAHEACTRAVELYPGCARIHFKLARLSERLSQMNQAISSYERTISIENSFRAQFQTMYPERQDITYRLNLSNYRQAQQRLTELAAFKK
jgi:O-antigen ligase